MKVLVIRTDFGVEVGGSIAHIQGVVNGFEKLGHNTLLVSPNYLSGIDRSRTMVINPGWLKYLYFGIGSYLYNWYGVMKAKESLDRFKPDVIYCRYGLYSKLALTLSRSANLPLIIEFNGSEVWVAKNWNVKLFSYALAQKIELEVLKGASAIIVVSKPIKKQLTDLGIPAQKILVNPNGVDCDKYNPRKITKARQAALKKKLGIRADQTVVGFIGTFGVWHGLQLIVEAVNTLVRERKLKAGNVVFLLIGDGVVKKHITEKISEYKLEDYFILPGIVPQEQGGLYVSIFDIALNPTVPNSDGSEFFGSPTKLFEYMALEKAIISSNIGQMGEILTHNKTALLIDPNNKQELAESIYYLVCHPDKRMRLGREAASLVRASYTWEKNVDRSLAMIQNEN